jgi:hypothetical protein
MLRHRHNGDGDGDNDVPQHSTPVRTSRSPT